MSSESKPPAYCQWVQLDEHCSCGLRKAVHQRKFENSEQKYLLQGLPLDVARIKAIKELGHLKLCCLRDLTYFPTVFICDATTNALTDITANRGSAIQKNNRIGNDQGVIGWEFLPVTNGNLGFNMSNYCQKLFSITQSSLDKIGLNRGNASSGDKKPCQFSNFYISRSQDYPLEDPSTPFPSDEQLAMYASI